MIIYVQWAKLTAEDWFAWDVTRDQDVRRAAKKAAPNDQSALDDNPGWVCGANCQGIDFTGWDHIAVQVVDGGGLRITGWQDDPDDWPPGTRHAVEWTLMPLAPDPAIGGRLNTVQSRRVWAEQDVAHLFPDSLPWEQFVLPPANQTFHGIWMSDEKFVEHVQARTVRSWHEWAAP